MHRVRAQDLTVTFDGPRLLIRSVPRAIGARVPPQAAMVLAFCAEPRTAEDVARAMGPQMAQLFEGLAGAGFLVDPEDAASTPAMFEGFGRLDVHRRMLDDRARVDGYAAAIAEVVQPEHVVVDAGTGTGVLAVMAAKAGARRVFGVDNADVLGLAEQVVHDSDVSVDLLQGDFATVQLPEQVDVVVTETFGALALAEGAAADLAELCKRHLKPGGIVIPRAVQFWIAPVGTSVTGPLLKPFQAQHGVELSSLAREATRRGITTLVPGDALLAAPECIERIGWPDVSDPHGQATFDASEPVTGLCAWFDLEMTETQVLSTSPTAPATHWKQVVLPLPELPAGPITVELEIVPDPADRRGIEVHSTLTSKGTTHRFVHRVR